MAQGRTVHQAGCGANQTHFSLSLKATNRRKPKPTEQSTLFVAGCVGLIIWKDVCAVQTVRGRKAKGMFLEWRQTFTGKCSQMETGT